MSQLGKKLLISVGSLVVATVAVELGLRAAGYDPLGSFQFSGRQDPGELLGEGFLRESDDEILVYEFAPGASAHAWGADVEINSHGFRDREFEHAVPEGLERIVALGDSATFGIRLPAGVLWPRVLEQELRAAGREVEVLNLGIVGYDTLEEVAFLERAGLAFAPDVVVVAYHVNDVGFASPTRDYIRRLQSYGSPLYRSRIAQGLRVFADRVALTRQHQRTDRDDYFAQENAAYIVDVTADAELTGRMEALRDAVDAEPELERGAHRYLRWHRAPARLGKLRFALERLGRLADEHDFDVWVFPVPWLADEGLEDAYDLGFAIARHEVERAGFRWLDTLPATRAAGHGELLILPNDFGHPNADGHRLLAARVAEALLAE